MSFNLYNLEDINNEKWEHLTNNQKGYVTFYDMSVIRNFDDVTPNKNIKLAIIEDENQYLIGLPGIVEDNIFQNLFFKTFDNLDVLISNAANQKHIEQFVSSVKNKFRGIILKNFNTRSILYNNDLKFIGEPGRKCPYLDLPATTEEIFTSISKSFKKTLRWNINGLVKKGIKWEIISENSIPENLYRDFLALHAQRLETKNISSNFLSSIIQTFFINLNKKKNTKAVFCYAYHENEFLGAIYGIKSGKSFAYIGSGIKSDIDKFSIGQFLIFQLIDRLISENYKRFDFLRGTEFYKSLWTKQFTLNDTRYFYTGSSFYKIASLFYKANKTRFGRLKCIKIIIKSLSSPKSSFEIIA